MPSASRGCDRSTRVQGGGWSTNPPPDGASVATYDGVLLLHLDGSLYTGNTQATHDTVLASALAVGPPGHTVALEGRGHTQVTVPMVDAAIERSSRAAD